MPRLVLHQRRRDRYIRDLEGANFPDVDAARAEAIEAARELISEESLKGKIDLTTLVEIVDETGATVLVVPFSTAVAVKM
jgi:hypothetical protein